jgi:hypothetical protein
MAKGQPKAALDGTNPSAYSFRRKGWKIRFVVATDPEKD